VQQPQNQQPLVPNWWRLIVLAIIAILVLIVLYNIISDILPDFGGLPGGGGGGNCLTTCSGFAVVQAPGCDCPPKSHISPTTPYAYNGPGCEKGCRQCICE